MAGRYATALFELALEAGAVDSVLADLKRFDALLDESADLTRLARSPVFTAEVAVTTAATPYRKPLTMRTFGFVQPRDFLRLAPIDPRYSMAMPDYLFESGTIISNDPGPLNWRYVRDVIDTTLFDDLFVIALAASVAMKICEEVTQSTAKLTTIAAIYEKALYDARVADGIESGPIEPEEDEWITVRRDGGWGVVSNLGAI